MNPIALRRVRWTALVGLGGLLTAATVSADWPAWRGPVSDGHQSGSGYPEKWTVNEVRWKLPLPGKGSSTPIVWKDRVYLTTPAEGQDTVMAVDLKDGEVIWQTSLGPETPAKHATLGSSSNASPVTDGTSVFVYFKSGRFAALDMEGKVRWSQNLTEQFGREQLYWDTGTSPVVTDRHVVMTRMHGGESWIAGFDKETGKLAWKQDRNFQTPSENDNGYTTPVTIQHEGRPALLVWGADHLTAHDAADGRLLWTVGGFNPEGTGFWPAIASPVVQGDMVVVPVGRDDRNDQSRVHGIRLGGSGDVTETHRVWKRDDLGVFASTPALHEGRVYLLRHRGEVVCLDPATGKTLWSEAFPRERAPYYSSPLVAGGKLYAAREDGTVFVARVGEKFEMLSANDMGERLVASPVPAGTGILLRGDAHLFLVAGGS